MEQWAELRREHFVRGVSINQLVKRTGLARKRWIEAKAALLSQELSHTPLEVQVLAEDGVSIATRPLSFDVW